VATSDQIKEHISRRNEKYELNKIGNCIKSIMGTGNRSTNLSTIKIKDAHTPDPEVIQEKLTNRYQDNFTLLETSHPIAKTIQKNSICGRIS
jgi:hypothetical protein